MSLDKENDRYHVEALALSVFANADRADRAGKAAMGTAKAYLAAAHFLEVNGWWGVIGVSKARVWSAASR